jgi:hypothetical protein
MLRDMRQNSGIAQQELDQRTRSSPFEAGKTDDTWIALTNPPGEIEIGLASLLLSFIRELSNAQSDDEAAAALRKADTSLNDWESNRRARVPRLAFLNPGVVIASPIRRS